MEKMTIVNVGSMVTYMMHLKLVILYYYIDNMRICITGQ